MTSSDTSAHSGPSVSTDLGGDDCVTAFRGAIRINDVDIAALRTLRGAASAPQGPEKSSWRASSVWEPGRDDQAHCFGGDAEGEGEPTPQEQLLAVVNTCVLLGFRIRCALDGLHLDRVRVTSTGETDLKGLVCLPTPEPGFGSIAVRIEINAPAGEGRLRRLALEALEASPVISTLRCSVNPSMEITVLE